MQCPKGHYLYPHRGVAPFHKKVFGARGNGITACDNCFRNMIQKEKIYWRCLEDCDYDLCYKCLPCVKEAAAV